MPNITGTFRDKNYVVTFTSITGAFSGSDGDYYQTRGEPSSSSGPRKITFNASKGETKTDGTLKTADEHHVYGAANGVQPQNISIRLWKRNS